MTDVPVLLVAFNRPERLASLISRLREVKPTTLYVAVDGARPHVAGEGDRVAATRAQVDLVDWACEVRTLFRDENLGCGRGVSGAITWLFREQERGIILEDDLLPHPSFFAFCEELLDRFEADSRVWAVSGCNFVPEEVLSSGDSYRFSTVPHIWGWATWRRTWSAYDFGVPQWWRTLPMGELWRSAGRSPSGAVFWAVMFELVRRRAVDTWDFQAVHAAFVSRGLTATANVNLVENVGFGADATHTGERPAYLRPVQGSPQPLQHPSSVTADAAADRWSRRHVLGATPTGLTRQAMRLARQKATG